MAFVSGAASSGAGSGSTGGLDVTGDEGKVAPTTCNECSRRYHCMNCEDGMPIGLDRTKLAPGLGARLPSLLSRGTKAALLDPDDDGMCLSEREVTLETATGEASPA